MGSESNPSAGVGSYSICIMVATSSNLLTPAWGPLTPTASQGGAETGPGREWGCGLTWWERTGAAPLRGDMVARDRWQLWASRTHDGGAERVEGVGPAGVEVGAVQPLQEPHVVEALGLQGGSAGVTGWEKRGQPLPGSHPAALPCCSCPSAGSPSASPGRLPSGSARGRETATA